MRHLGDLGSPGAYLGCAVCALCAEPRRRARDNTSADPCADGRCLYCGRSSVAGRAGRTAVVCAPERAGARTHARTHAAAVAAAAKGGAAFMCRCAGLPTRQPGQPEVSPVTWRAAPGRSCPAAWGPAAKAPPNLRPRRRRRRSRTGPAGYPPPPPSPRSSRRFRTRRGGLGSAP